jgi:hypothetical protein
MKLPYTLHVDMGYPAPLSSHKTLTNAKRAIATRLTQWSKKLGGQAFCYAYRVEHKGETVYTAGGWR